ncbi:MAG: hypothetical protein ACK4UT_05935 [Moraxellaceae bacterium]
MPSPAGFALAALLLAGTAEAATLAELRSQEGLTPPPEPRPAETLLQPAGEKHDYLLSAWRKDGQWGVVSEQRPSPAAGSRAAAPTARWLAKPVHEAVLLPRLTRPHGHLWLKAADKATWQAYRSDGKKLTALEATPYREMCLLRAGKDKRPPAARNDPGQDSREAYPDLVLGIHAGLDPASAVVDLIDAGQNRVLLTLARVDTRREPLLERRLLLLAHDADVNGHTVIRLPEPPAPGQGYAALEDNAFYRHLDFEGPLVTGVEPGGKTVILDRHLRPYAVPGLTLGEPAPLDPAWAANRGPQGFLRIPVTTSDGDSGYRLIHSSPFDRHPLLDRRQWKDIRMVDGHVVVQEADGQWQLLTRYMVSSYIEVGRYLPELGTVRSPSLEGMSAAIAEALEAKEEKRREEVRQAALHARQQAEQMAKWRAEAAERERQEAAARAAAVAAQQAAAQAAQAHRAAIESARQVVRNLWAGRGESPAQLSAAADTVIRVNGAGFSASEIYTIASALKRVYGGDRATLGRLASALDSLHLTAANGEDFRRRRDNATRSWGNMAPIDLPSASGAPGLSTMEKDYYDNRGNARNPYVLRERKP